MYGKFPIEARIGVSRHYAWSNNNRVSIIDWSVRIVGRLDCTRKQLIWCYICASWDRAGSRTPMNASDKVKVPLAGAPSSDTCVPKTLVRLSLLARCFKSQVSWARTLLTELETTDQLCTIWKISCWSEYLSIEMRWLKSAQARSGRALDFMPPSIKSIACLVVTKLLSSLHSWTKDCKDLRTLSEWTDFLIVLCRSAGTTCACSAMHWSVEKTGSFLLYVISEWSPVCQCKRGLCLWWLTS